MKRMTRNRVALFIGVMSAVAIVLYLPRYAREQRRIQAALQQQRVEQAAAQTRTEAQARVQAEQVALQTQQMAAREAAQKAAAEIAEYKFRYLSPGFGRKSGMKNVAIVAATMDGEQDRSVASALDRRLEDENLALFTSFFKPAFFTDGLFSNIFAGSLESIDRLQLTNTLDALLLAQEQVEYSTNGANLDYVVTARARLDMAFLPLDLMRREQSWTFAASGAGFSPGEALKNAEDRLSKQITDDTNMSLVPLSSDNQEPFH